LSVGPFVLDTRIGRGGMGEVWRARHVQQDVAVALKVLTATGSRDAMFVESFRNEVRAAAGLDHPHIATVLDYGSVPPDAAERSDGQLVAGTPYLSMELVEGGTLADHMGTLPWSEIERLLRGLLDALAHAHARGVIHRDLKLSNVLYDPASGLFRLTDFGIAHAMAATSDPFRWGTPAYLPPEQLLGRWWDYGPWTDLYALGCCAFALVTGERAFPDAVSGEAMRRRLPRMVPRVDVPLGFEVWMQQLCEPEPEARFQLAADAAYVLHQLCRSFAPSLLARSQAPSAGERADTTTTLVFEPLDYADEETVVAVRSTGHRPPPMPVDWRRRDPRTATKLAGAGLGLYGLRRIPMIGRVEERTALWEALRDVRDGGRAKAVVVHGPAGCGKTRLAEWLAERALELGAATVLRAVHSPTGTLGDGLRGMVSRYLRLSGLSDAQIRQRVGAAIAPASSDRVRALLDVVSPRNAAPVEVRNAAVLDLVAHLAERRPVVLVLDDVQWGPDTLEAALTVLDGERRSRPILLVLIARDEALSEQALTRSMLLDVERRPGTKRIELGPLSPEAHRRLVDELLGLERGLAQLVEERTAGNPMFAVQLVGDWVGRGVLVPGPRGFVLRRGTAISLPDDLFATWAQRVDELLYGRPETDRSCLEVAAILGPQVDRTEWRAACAAAGFVPSADLIDALLSHRLARAEDEAVSRGGWVFGHNMLRESLIRRAEESGRAPAHHRACATVVARSGPGQEERLAGHLLGAQALDEALGPLATAMDARLRAGDVDRADSLLRPWEEAVAALPLPPDDPRWVSGLRAAATVHRHRDRPENVRRACAALELGVRHYGWPAGVLADVRSEEGLAARTAGAFAEAVDRFRDGLRTARDTGTRAALHARIGETLVWLGAFTGAEAESRLGLQLAADVGDAGATGEGWIGIATACVHRGEIDEATRAAARARDACRQGRHRAGLAAAWHLFGEIARQRHSWDEAVHCYRTSAGLWSSLGTLSAVVRPELHSAFVELERGGAVEVAPHLDSFADRTRQNGLWPLVAVVRLAQLAADASRDDGDAWDVHYAEASGILVETQLLSPDVAWTAEQAGRAARRDGWLGRAREVFDLALAQYTRLGREEDADRVGWGAG
jgi:tetratricopeptide (TPR) repeat protein